MSELSVGVRDLKIRLSEYLRQVKRGYTILITDHGKPIGRILPVEPSLDQRIEMLSKAGLLAWNGKKLPPIQPKVINRSQSLISDLLVEMRQ